MKLDARHTGAVLVLDVPLKCLDADNSTAFKSAALPLLAGETRVVLHVGALEFIDSSGIGALLSCLRAVTEAGGEMCLGGVSESVRAVLDLLRLHRLLGIHDGLEEALVALQARA